MISRRSPVRARSILRRAPCLAALALLLGACGDDEHASDSAADASATGESTTTGETTGESASSTSSTNTTGSTTDASTTGTTTSTTTGPDPLYLRECQEGDFICDDWGCEQAPVVASGECYKRCTPTVIGAADEECDEPERPYCSQVGLALGGDYQCNSCAHICVAAAINHCDQGIASCPTP